MNTTTFYLNTYIHQKDLVELFYYFCTYFECISAVLCTENGASYVKDDVSVSTPISSRNYFIKRVMDAS